MKKTIFTLTALCSAATLLAAPQRPDAKPAAAKPAVSKPAAAKPAVSKPAPAAKPAVSKPAPIVKPAPAAKPIVPPPVPVAPVIPPPFAEPRVVNYTPVRNTYTIQLNHDRVILFEQRLVSIHELREKIRMVSNDRPRPLITVKIVEGVNNDRLEYTLAELRKAGFNDVQIIRLARRAKMVLAPRKAAPRMKR